MINHPNRSLRATITTITQDADGNLIFGQPIELPRAKAYAQAKKLAGRGYQFVAHYGPNSCAYVGHDVTAVIAE